MDNWNLNAIDSYDFWREIRDLTKRIGPIRENDILNF